MTELIQRVPVDERPAACRAAIAAARRVSDAAAPPETETRKEIAPKPAKKLTRLPSDYKGVRGIHRAGELIWTTDVGVHGTRVRIDHATEREAAISYDAVRVWYRGEARLNFPERWPGDGSSVYAGVSRYSDDAMTRAPWRVQHDGRELTCPLCRKVTRAGVGAAAEEA